MPNKTKYACNDFFFKAKNAWDENIVTKWKINKKNAWYKKDLNQNTCDEN